MRTNIGPRVGIGLLATVLAAGCDDTRAEPDGGAPDGGIVLEDASPDTGRPDTGPPAECPEGYALGDYYGKPTVEVRIDGEGPFVFVYDTGAPSSGMDESVGATVGEGPHAFEVAGHTTDVAGLPTFDAAAIGLDGVEGILGRDIMGGFAVTLDVARGRIWLNEERDEAALLACDHVRADPAEADMAGDQYLYVRGRAEDEPGWFLVDSGASLGAMPDSVFDTLQERRERPFVGGFYTRAAIGTFWARLTAIARHEVAGYAVEHIVTRTLPDDVLPSPSADETMLGVLPSGYLKHFLVTIDHPRETLRLDAYADMPLREPASYFPVGIGLEEATEPPFRVAQVLAGSAAEEEGVQVGDEILSVSGRDIADMTASQRPWAFVRPSEGERVEVTLRPEGEAERTVTLEARALLTAPSP